MTEVGRTYRHYKGTLYKVLALGKHSETEEYMVVYQDVQHPEHIWIRPQYMFEEQVTIDKQDSAAVYPCCIIMEPVASAGGIVLNPEGKIALVEQGGNSWSFPKGGVEEGETPKEAALREVFEETGLQDLVYVKDLGSYTRHGINYEATGEDYTKPPRTRILFLFRTNSHSLVWDGVEITDARFVTVDEALSLLTHPKDKAFLESVRSSIEV